MTDTIFIAYARNDGTKFAQQLHDELESDGYKVWIDKRDIRSSEYWDDAIQAALDDCEVLILVMTPDSTASRNCKDEWSYVRDKKKPIIPLMVIDTDIPYQLSKIQRIDFREDFEQGIAQLRIELRKQVNSRNLRDADVEPELEIKQHLRERRNWLQIQSLRGIIVLILIMAGVVTPVPEFINNDLPRVDVTWFEARDYCASRGARLPTEREWEYAARGPDGLLYPWGNGYEMYRLNDSNQSGEDNFDFTAPIDAFGEYTTWVGAYQMSGNVREWVGSSNAPYPYRFNDGREDDEEPLIRIIRGGAFDLNVPKVNTTERDESAPDEVYINTGSRCARDFAG